MEQVSLLVLLSWKKLLEQMGTTARIKTSVICRQNVYTSLIEHVSAIYLYF